jgi:hypothetical protein
MNSKGMNGGIRVLACAALGSALALLSGCGPEDAEGARLATLEQGVAAGCTTSQPTSIGGGVYGHPDNNSVNASIGVELINANGVPVDELGRACSGTTDTCIGNSNYAFMVNINPGTSPLGTPSTTPGMTRSWSRCVAGNVTSVYYEGYPRNESGVTDETRYGETMSNKMLVSSGGTLRYDMRLPVRYEADAVTGNTGNANGWAYCNGSPTPVTRINGWTTTPNSGCGIHAYQSGGNINNANGYWWIGPLAAGQCNAAYQTVAVVVHVNCNGQDMAKTININITKGKTIGAVNYYFP